jgi:large conductance mechanosensitive channel
MLNLMMRMCVAMSTEAEKETLEELRRIRSLLEPKPSPKPRNFMEEFMGFLNKYGVIGLAIGFIMGGAASRFVTALVQDMLMPFIGIMIPGGEWRKIIVELGPIKLLIGDFTGALIDFSIIAVVIFLLVKQLSKTGLK